MKKATIAAALLCWALPLAARTPSVEVTARNTADNSLVFDAAVEGYGTFTVRLNVTDIRNHAGDSTATVTVAVGSEGGELYALAPQDASRPVEADFAWDWINGKLDAVPDLGLVYRLPLAAGRSTVVHSLTPAEAGIMRGNIVGFRMWEFTAEENEPIFAIRGGTVIEVEGYDGESGEPGGGSIVVEHADGTQARYSSLRSGSARVAPGDTVRPDTPIALAGKLRSGGHGVRIGLYRYAANRNTAQYPSMMSQTEYINPLFMTARGSDLLADGETVKVKTTRKLLNAEAGRKNFRQRLSER
ncbi:MAG TPA: M23 family metallopeptidase [Candidatus Tidjanibacter gallistercoris]|nr:M23 family metallopeptidase [Candidatus Tidjanibacter gallistercoris]